MARELDRQRAQEARENRQAEALRQHWRSKQALEAITSLHRDVSPPIDWHVVASPPPPEPPQRTFGESQRAKQALETYRPGFLAQILGLTGHRDALEEALKSALQQEEEDYRRAAAAHAEAVSEWERRTAFARRVLSGDVTAYELVYRESKVAQRYDFAGAGFKTLTQRAAHVEVDTVEPDRMPTTETTLTATGRISQKRISKSRFWDFYQQHLCSAALMVARELLGMLPLLEVLVDVRYSALDPSTGHERPFTVLSVRCARETISTIEFAKADPVAVVRRLPHELRCSKSKGIQEITPIPPSSLPR